MTEILRTFRTKFKNVENKKKIYIKIAQILRYKFQNLNFENGESASSENRDTL